MKVGTASFYLLGATQQWFYRFHKNHGSLPPWPTFVDAINKRFGPPIHSNPLCKLAHLRRTGSVDDFQALFLSLLACCEGITKTQQIALFTPGLGKPMSIDVEMQKPETLEDAMALARAFEHRAQVTANLQSAAPRGSPRQSPPVRSSSTPAAAT